ncbi:MAG TPA: YifB family Mg chelatase-like AAA ATPase [Aeromicrobium sp.]|nr:YifB family Mg chelatase-like AAA ATPase [Aeromicrobium sp.]
MAATHSVALDGLAGRPIEVEVDINSGMPGTVLVGLADTIVNEARDRVRAAVVNSGTSWPDQRVTINLAPSNVPKTGSHFDVAIAAALFVAKREIPADLLADVVLLGELALDGRLRAVRGVLPATMAAAAAGFRAVYVPESNASEAALVPDIDVVGLRSLRQLVAMLTGQPEPEDPPVPPLDEAPFARGADVDAGLDVADVAGQEDARTAMLVAAAGGHHLAMTGPPGIGKTMLAKRLPGLLPDLSPSDALEVSAVHSVAGFLPADAPLVERPPFIDPHHTSSAVAIIGGGTRGIRPGAMSLAHRGVLFMDEAPEFASNVLDALRQPLENGHIFIARANQTALFPARFQLILASNPCPCGQDGAASGQCHCTSIMRRRYLDRVTGPIRDRIDIHRTLTLPSRPELAQAIGRSQTTGRLAAVVAEARDRQSHRLIGTPWRLNSEVPGSELRKRWPIDEAARVVLDRQLSSHKLSARSVDRILGLAWSVADLRGHGRPSRDDALLALSLRNGTPLTSDLRELVAVS